MTKTSLLLAGWLIAGAVAVGQAQIVTVSDRSSGQPLEMATLNSLEPMAFVTTDAHGQADLAEFIGSGAIVVRMLGFISDTVSYQELLLRKDKLMLVPMELTLDQVVVSATRWNQSKRDVPGHISSLSAKEVRMQNPQTAADMIAATGEVLVQKSQLGGGSPMIRGFATNRVLISVDGIRMNTAIFRSGNVQNIINIDPFTVEHTEVFFGPGSVIYGSDAIGGVMNFNTNEPVLSLTDRPDIEGNAVFRYASASTELTGHVDLNFGWKKWAMLTSVSYSDFGDLRMGSHGPEDYLRPTYVVRNDTGDVEVKNKEPRLQVPSGYSQISAMQKFRYVPNKHWQINYGMHFSTTSDYARYDRHLRTRNGLPRYGQWDYGPQLWMLNNLNLDHSSTNLLYDQLNIRLAHQWFRESRISRNFNDSIRSVQQEEVQAYSLNIDLKKNIRTVHLLYYGVEGVFNDVFSLGREENILAGTSIEGPSRYPRSNWTSIGAYATYRFVPSEKISLQAGLRYSHFVLNAKFDTTFYPLPFTSAHLNNGALTGSVGAVYNPNRKWALSLNLSTGFRAPNIDDMGKVFDSGPGAVVVPNSGLKAEYAYNAELGLAKIFSRWLKVDITGYYTFLNNAMVRRDYHLNGLDSLVYLGEMSRVQAIQNAANAFVYGVQTGVEVKFPKGFSVLSRFNYQYGREQLEDGSTGPLRHAGPWFGSSHLIYSMRSLRLDLYAVYNGTISNTDLAAEEKDKAYLYADDDQGRPYSPGWYTVNFKAMYWFGSHIMLSVGIENITDQRYRPYSSGISAPGRNFILALHARF